MSDAPEASAAAGPAGSGSGSSEEGTDQQRVVRVRGSRRAQLTPAPGTIAEPPEASARNGDAAPAQGGSGPNDERLRREVPPHY